MITIANEVDGRVERIDEFQMEALRLRDAAEISLQTRQADELRKWLVDKWSEPFVNVRAMVNSGPSSLRETKVVRKLIPILEMNGWLVKATAAVEVMGKNAPEAWEVVRT